MKLVETINKKLLEWDDKNIVFVPAIILAFVLIFLTVLVSTWFFIVYLFIIVFAFYMGHLNKKEVMRMLNVR